MNFSANQRKNLLPDSRKVAQQSAIDVFGSELYHHGVKGQKWGVRKARSVLDSTEKSFRKSAKNLRSKADYAGAYAYLRTDSKGESKGNSFQRLDVKNAQARKERLNKKADRTENVAKGISMAKKLVSGMDMKQSIKTLQKAAGYSKSQVLVSKLLGRKDQLSFAAIDYALNKTNSGRKSIK